MSDISNETNEITVSVLDSCTMEWSDMLQWFDSVLEEPRNRMSDEMYEIAKRGDPDSAKKLMARTQAFTDEFHTIAKSWTPHQRINFYLHYYVMRDFITDAMEPWEIDYAMFCR